MAHAGKEIHQNYLNTFYRCITESKIICHDMVEEHKIVYIMSGRLTLRCGNRKVDVKNGQAVFVRRNHLVQEYKQPGADGEPFKGLFFHLNEYELRDMEERIEIPIVKDNESLKRELAVTLSPHPFLKGLFMSLDQYFSSDSPIPASLIKSKVQETVIVLMELLPDLAPILFDFSRQWKSDLREFMEKNYLCDMNVEQFAHFSGRSLSGFKREFFEIFGSTPHQWIVGKRLEYAKNLIENKDCPLSDVYLKAGFKNPAHFATCYKKRFRMTPSEAYSRGGIVIRKRK